MTRLRTIATAMIVLAAELAVAGDWPQWRGPTRDGQAASGPALAESWPQTGLRKLWESEPIPSGEKGGFGSVAVADGRAYLFAAVRTEEPLATRTLSAKAVKQLTWPPAAMPEHLAKAAEQGRLSDQRAALKPEELNPWIERWIAETLDEADIIPWSAACRLRLAQGRAGLSPEQLAKLATIRDKAFPDQAALDRWMADNGFAGPARDTVLRVVPTRRIVVTDTVYCLDAADGRTVWKKEFPGQEHPYGASSTPCIVANRCYVVGSDVWAYCLDARDGREVWRAQCAKGQVSSSFLVLDGRAFVQAPELTALDAEKGKVLWTQPKVVSLNASPAAWQSGGKTYLVCHNDADLACVDAADGAVKWRAPAGGNSTATVRGDVAVVMTDNKQVGLVAYHLAPERAEKLWNWPEMINAASPLVIGEHVFAATGGQMACLELLTGKLLWHDKRMRGASISSPVAVGDRIFHLAGNAKSVMMIRATPEKSSLLGKADLPTARAATPVVADGRLYLRLSGAVACYELPRAAPE